MANVATMVESGGVPPGFIKTQLLTTFAEWQQPEIEACLNVNLRRVDLRFLRMEPEKDAPCVIAGGGPSLRQMFPRIDDLARRGAHVFAMNDAARFLGALGVPVDGCVVWETHCVPTQLMAARDPLPTTHYIASRAHPDWFCMLRKQPIVTWHCYPNRGEDKIIEQFDPEPVYIAGGVAAALRTIEIGRALGYRSFHLFGMDGSCGDKTHAYGDTRGSHKYFEAWHGGKTYTTNHYWAQSAIDLVNQAKAYERQREKHGVTTNICLHGEGLIQSLAAESGIPVIR